MDKHKHHPPLQQANKTPETTSKTLFLSKVSIQTQGWKNQKKSCNWLSMHRCFVWIVVWLLLTWFSVRPVLLSSIYFPDSKKGKYAPGDLTRCKMFLNLLPASLIRPILLFLWTQSVKGKHRKQETGHSSSFLQIFRKYGGRYQSDYC